MPKVRDEFFALLRVYHAIIPTCDTPNGFGVLEIQTLELILSVIHDCFDRCNLQVQSGQSQILCKQRRVVENRANIFSAAAAQAVAALSTT